MHSVTRALPCQTSDPDMWFAEGTAPTEQARRLCHACHVRAACLEGALARSEPWGVWGGEVFEDGRVIPVKRGRGRPRKVA